MTKIDFAATFAHLASAGQVEESVTIGGINVRMVRIAGGGEGRWGRHEHSAETVLVWSGDFQVEFRRDVLTLAAGEGCVVPMGHDHRGTSKGGAEVILFTQPF